LDYGDSKRTKDLQDRPKSPSSYDAKKDRWRGSDVT
jgi:hypothetical protein